MVKNLIAKGTVLLALLASGRTMTAGPIPYESALAGAAITQSSLANIYQNGLVIGNGELNAIVYTSGNQIHLRVSKNDVWDSRINTSADAPLPKINPATGAFSGSGSQPSWNNYVYPTGLPCVEVVLAAAGGQTSWSFSTLDLAKASATVISDVDSTTIRALAQANAFHINSSRALSFIGINQAVMDSSGNSISSWVSNVTTGTTNGYSYVRQNIPGDADTSGMDVYIVAGASGTNNVVAVVTSRDSATPLADAVAIVTAELNDASTAATHESLWQNFWSASGIQLGDTTLQNWWYRMVYYNRCFATAGANAIGLKAGFDNLGGWHNSLKINYNSQQTYCLGGPVNHPEFIQPFVDAIIRNLPRGQWLATNTFVGVNEGAFFHSDWWPFEPDPAVCTTVNKHQQAYLPYGFSWGMQGHMAFNLWEFYRYNPTTNNLNKVWPALREFGRFYCALLEKCPMSNGKRQLAPSYFPENGSYGQVNTCYDIAFINCGLKAAMAAAGLMGDTVLSNRCATNLALMPTYSLTLDNGQTVIEQWLGSGLQGDDRHATEVQPVYPADEINWFSSQADKDLFKRTIARAEWITTHANSGVTLNIARARLSLGTDAINNLKLCFASNSSYSPEQLNGLFYWKDHGHYISEQFGIARCVTELLLQSVGDIIRIFPALPANVDGHFNCLLARGGFQVSADQVSGVISNVTITSTLGGSVSLVSPWAGRTLRIVDASTSGDVAYTNTNNVATFATTAGKTYLLAAAPSTPTGLRATQSGGQVLLAWNAATDAVGYNFKRSTTSGSSYLILTNTSATNFTDSSVVNGTTYFYVVSATNQIGESADSAPISITPGVGAGTNLIWSGTVNGNWNAATTNWSGNGLATAYQDGVTVLLDDTAPGNTTLNLTAAVSPASVTVNNSSLAYTISGSAIGGAGSLTKSGAGALTLSGINTFSGGTTINAGTVNLNNGGSSGTLRGNVTVNSGAVLQLNAGDAIGYSSGNEVTNINLNGGTVNNVVNANQAYNCTFNLAGGTMSSSGGGSYHFNGSSGGINSLAGSSASIISAPITLRANGLVINTATGTVPGGIDLDITGAIGEQYGSFNLTKAGAGVLRLQTAATYSGATIVSNGVLRLAGGGGTSGTLPNSTITVLGGAELQLNTSDALGYNNGNLLTVAGTLKQAYAWSETLNRPIILSGGTITSTGFNVYNEAYNFFGGYIRTLAGTSSLITGVGNFGLRTSSCYFTNEAGSTLTIACPIQGYLGTSTTPLNKTGAGTLVLSATNIYTGDTVISAGTLQLGDGVSADGSVAGNIINSATLAFANPGAQTYAGIISGTGSLIHNGAGKTTLTAANSYTGATTVNNGQLVVSTLFAGKGNFWVTNGAALGITSLSSGSALASNLTLAAGTALEFYNVSNTTTPLMMASNINLGGSSTIKVTDTNNLIVGNSYPLLGYAGSFSGNFTNLHLQMPSGLTGTLVGNVNQIRLQVVSSVSLTPPLLGGVISNGMLQLNWPSDHIGWPLQSQTNGLGTNWQPVANSSGTNLMFFPVDAANGSVFFRLTY